MLRAAFLKAELDFLKADPAFAEKLESVKTADDFDGLCALAEKILKSHAKANPSGRQLRDGRRDTSSQ